MSTTPSVYFGMKSTGFDGKLDLDFFVITNPTVPTHEDFKLTHAQIMAAPGVGMAGDTRTFFVTHGAFVNSWNNAVPWDFHNILIEAPNGSNWWRVPLATKYDNQTMIPVAFSRPIPLQDGDALCIPSRNTGGAVPNTVSVCIHGFFNQ